MEHGRIIASFDRATQARRGVLTLERRGLVDANDVRIKGIPKVGSDAEQGEADMDLVGHHARNFSIGGVLTGLAFAAVAIAAVLILDVEPTGLAVALAALAAVPGFFIGGFWGVARDLPVTDEAFDTYIAELSGYDGPVEVEVILDHGVDPDQVEAALRDLQPRDLHRVA